MPILYSRLQAILQAADHYHQRQADMLEYINAKLNLTTRGLLSTRDALQEISLHINTIRPEDVAHYATIREELALYRTHYHRRSPQEVRDRERDRLREKRHPGEFTPGVVASYLDAKAAAAQAGDGGSSRPRTAAEVAAAVDAEDDAFAGLADLGPPPLDTSHIEPLSQPAILPPDQDAAYQAFRAARAATRATPTSEDTSQ